MRSPKSTALGLAIWLAAATVASGLDTVRTSQRSYSGSLVDVNAREVTIQRQNERKSIPVNQITGIVFDGEPPQLKQARRAIDNGRYEDAQAALAKVDLAKIRRKGIRQEVQFYRALCAARLALRGTGTILEAGSQMAAFVVANPDSYHWLEANALVGDLLMASGRNAKAVPYYTNLGKVPWPEYRMRADAAIGRALLADGKPAEARQAFERVLAEKTVDEPTTRQRHYAQLGKALCLAAQGKADEAVKLAQQVILKTNPENVALNARAYNTLGTILRKSGKPREALLAFLHVDLLYFGSPEDHAEALANLADLWTELHKPERAIETRELLKNRYKNSRWAS